MIEEHNEEQQQQGRRDACIGDACLYTDFTGCGSVDFGGDGGCTDFDMGGCGGDGGCVDLDIGGCGDIGSGCSTLFFLPLRWMVILGLMLYGDWDYDNHRAK